MRFPLTQQLLQEAEQFSLRSSCRHCLFYVPAQARCAHEWPDLGQSRWPLNAPDTAPDTAPDAAPDTSGDPPVDVEFCKEFELS